MDNQMHPPHISFCFYPPDNDLPSTLLASGITPDTLFVDRDIPSLTEGHRQDPTITTPNFIRVLEDYAKNYSMQPIVEDKPLFLQISPDGEFSAVCKEPNGHLTDACLSETEEILFRYYCFLHRYLFWQAYAPDPHPLPLWITDFAERLDKRVDVRRHLRPIIDAGLDVTLCIATTKTLDMLETTQPF